MLNAGAVALFSKTNTVKDSKSNDKAVKSTDFTSMFVNQSKKNSNDSVSGFKTNDSNSTASNSTKVRKEIKQLFNKSKINDSKNKQSVNWNENDLAEEEITNDDISKKYDALCQSIMELIANHLNTSSENIANSMEKLNINPQELANLQNVTKLVADVKGKTDLMGLLTETDGSNAIKSIMSELDDLIEQFKEDLGMNQQEFQDFVEDYLKVLNSQGNISENSGLQVKNDVQTD